MKRALLFAAILLTSMLGLCSAALCWNVTVGTLERGEFRRAVERGVGHGAPEQEVVTFLEEYVSRDRRDSAEINCCYLFDGSELNDYCDEVDCTAWKPDSRVVLVRIEDDGSFRPFCMNGYFAYVVIDRVEGFSRVVFRDLLTCL